MLCDVTQLVLICLQCYLFTKHIVKIIVSIQCWPIRTHMKHIGALFVKLFIGMEPFGALRLFAEPDAVTQGFVLVQMDRNIIFLYLVMREKPRLLQVCVCNSVIVVKNKLIWPE